MPETDVELIRRLVDAFNRGDFGTIEELCCDDFEFVSVFTAVDSGEATYRGRTAWTEYAVVMDETWDDWRVEDLRLFDSGEGGVAALMRLVGTGKRSGVPIDRPTGITYKLHDGKLWRVRSYPDPAEALKAVGLEEDAAPAG